MSFYSAPKYIVAFRSDTWQWAVFAKAKGRYGLDPEHYVHFVDANSKDRAKEIAEALNKGRETDENYNDN